jgi:hypothetical protein
LEEKKKAGEIQSVERPSSKEEKMEQPLLGKIFFNIVFQLLGKINTLAEKKIFLWYKMTRTK